MLCPLCNHKARVVTSRNSTDNNPKVIHSIPKQYRNAIPFPFTFRRCACLDAGCGYKFETVELDSADFYQLHNTLKRDMKLNLLRLLDEGL